MKLDFHSHILPGIDDGATDLANAVELTRAMAGWGFERITCTPHINAAHSNTPDDIRQAFDNLQDKLYIESIDIDRKSVV